MLYQLPTSSLTPPWRRCVRRPGGEPRRLRNPFKSVRTTTLGARATAAAFEMFVNATRRYAKAGFRASRRSTVLGRRRDRRSIERVVIA